MKKSTFIITFIFSTVSIFAQTSFLGDITDPNYVNRYAFTQIVSTYSEQGKLPKVTIYTFGENGRVTEKKEQQGKRTVIFQYAYDNNWNMTEIKKEINGTLDRSEKFTYDTLNRVTQTVVALFEEKDSVVETMTWTDNSSRHTKRLYKGSEIAILTAYDAKKRPLNEVKLDGSGMEWAYVDDLMVMSKKKGLNGALLNIDRYDYDADNRIRMIENAELQKTYQYDNNGLLTKIHVFESNGLLIGWEQFEYVFVNK